MADTAACALGHGPDGTGHVSRMLSQDIVAAADILVSLDPEASGVLGRMSAHLPMVPTILDLSSAAWCASSKRTSSLRWATTPVGAKSATRSVDRDDEIKLGRGPKSPDAVIPVYRLNWK